MKNIKKNSLKNKTILVTGGTGSFGNEFVNTILNNYSPKKIIVYSRDELKQFNMQNSFINNKNFKKLRFFIGDIRDKERLSFAINSDVDYVVHAAALKQVPTAEFNPFEAVKTNIIGSQNVIECCLKSNVTKVVALSTDKAAAPINLYGATKLTSDKLFVSANNYKGWKNIKFSVVRYGNVMGSRGSVIPFFIEKAKTGILPITDKNMTRFNITLEQGVTFVINSLNNMWGGEIFIPKIPSYKIIDVAKAVSSKSKIKIVGVRPGEKIHEEMITVSDGLRSIEFNDYYVILPSSPKWKIDDFIKKSNYKKAGKYCSKNFSYNSFTNKDFLTVKELKKLISKL